MEEDFFFFILQFALSESAVRYAGSLSTLLSHISFCQKLDRPPHIVTVAKVELDSGGPVEGLGKGSVARTKISSHLVHYPLFQLVRKWPLLWFFIQNTQFLAPKSRNTDNYAEDMH